MLWSCAPGVPQLWCIRCSVGCRWRAAWHCLKLWQAGVSVCFLRQNSKSGSPRPGEVLGAAPACSRLRQPKGTRFLQACRHACHAQDHWVAPLVGLANASQFCCSHSTAGMDVTRKVINLARECGNKIELSAVDTGQCVCHRTRLSSRKLRSTCAGAVPCPAAQAPGVAPAATANACCLPCGDCAAESLVPEPLKTSPSPQEFMDSLHQVECCCAVLCLRNGGARGAAAAWLPHVGWLQIAHRVGHGFVGGDAAAHFTRAC